MPDAFVSFSVHATDPPDVGTFTVSDAFTPGEAGTVTVFVIVPAALIVARNFSTVVVRLVTIGTNNPPSSIGKFVTPASATTLPSRFVDAFTYVKDAGSVSSTEIPVSENRLLFSSVIVYSSTSFTLSPVGALSTTIADTLLITGTG